MEEIKSNQYQCENCGGIFEKVRSDEEAQAEAEQEFPGETDLAIVCDECYKEIMRQYFQ